MAGSRYEMGAMMERIELWRDPDARPGPEAMAVDEWLMAGGLERPLLRVYRWRGAWGSLGCFGRIEEARSAVAGVEWVRRRTGGGVVDHRADWTYSLLLPAGEGLARARGAESYRVVHRALADALTELGLAEARMEEGEGGSGALCFANPVRHDLLDATGGKLAGAGQRRGREGLLHQGSLALRLDEDASAALAEALATRLARELAPCERVPDGESLGRLVEARYGHAEWLERR